MAIVVIDNASNLKCFCTGDLIDSGRKFKVIFASTVPTNILR